jgi:hypothetical protein
MNSLMTHSAANDSSLSLMLIEAGLTLISIAAAFCVPKLGGKTLQSIERASCVFARRKGLAVVSVGCAMLLLRLALLPWVPAPRPFNTDDFSFLLAADTFAHGRLTNPTPAMWTHLESIHITMQPTYMSMYFPGPGLVMAAGKVIFGHPWAGILITAGIMCAALCWMLQAWLPPGWALLGGVLAILRIGLFSYWVNTFTGGATLSVTGGALVLGALPRLIKTGRFRYGMILAVGIVLLVMTRPYEGMLVCLPVAGALVYWVLFGKNRPPLLVVVCRALAPLALVAATLAWMGYYNDQAFGKPTILPYTIARNTYAVVPYYIWQPAHPTPHYRNAEMRKFYTECETLNFDRLHTPATFLKRNFEKLNSAVLFFAGIALLPCILMARRVVLDRRMRFFLYAVPLWVVGLFIGVFLIPHYLAPFTAAVYVLGLQAIRHLRVWRPEGRPVGRSLVRLLVTVCILLAAVRVAAEPLHLMPPRWPLAPWICTWVGPGNFGADRAQVVEKLEKTPGRHLVLVQYSPAHEPDDEWVYNDADVDNSKVIWAREMNPDQDAELMRYYKDRDVWLVQPDVSRGMLTPYPGSLRLDAALSSDQ